MEVNSAFAMLAAFGVLTVWGPGMWSRMQNDMVHRLESLASAGTKSFTIEDTMSLFFDVVKVMSVLTAPILIGMLAVGVLASVVQVRPRITPDVLKPRFSKINPI